MNVRASSVNSTAGEEDNLEIDAWKEQPWKGKGIHVLWYENQDHAQVFDKQATRRPLLRAIKAYCAEGLEID